MLKSPAALLFVCVVLSGCQRSGNGLAEPGRFGPVGESPLRRLSNSEYLNALSDLFPDVTVELPELPNDVSVAGFENAAEAQGPSELRIARYEQIANQYARAATATNERVGALVGCGDWSTPSQSSACWERFTISVGRRIYRRPLTTSEVDRLAVRFIRWEASLGFVDAIALTLSAMLQSPQFIYRPETPGANGSSSVPLDDYAMAARLSFFLWESIPDDHLLDLAGRGELRTRAQIWTEAERMLSDAKVRRAHRNFFRQWLGLDRILSTEHQGRAGNVDPQWTRQTAQSAYHETMLFIENTLAGGGSFRDLLTSRRAWVDRDTARLYGVPFLGGDWSEVELPLGQRAGLLTRTAFLAGYSHRGGVSPPLRGTYVLSRLLCAPPGAPPPSADLSMPVPRPEAGPQTSRMLFTERTSGPACQGCHVSIDAFGFGFEHYNAAGHYRSIEVGLPIDASGLVLGTDVDGPFDNAVEMSERLSQSRTVHRCATEHWLRYALGRAPDPNEQSLVDWLSDDFFENNGDVRALLLRIVTSSTFRLQGVTR